MFNLTEFKNQDMVQIIIVKYVSHNTDIMDQYASGYTELKCT